MSRITLGEGRTKSSLSTGNIWRERAMAHEVYGWVWIALLKPGIILYTRLELELVMAA